MLAVRFRIAIGVHQRPVENLTSYSYTMIPPYIPYYMKHAITYACQENNGILTIQTLLGGTEEENATCYLQILLADHIAGFCRSQQMQDMDHWGYSFRLGSAAAWFHHDAEDAKNWLVMHKIIAVNNKITWKLRS